MVTDGPYGETKELFGGFWILDVASKEEAVEWAKRAPLAGPGTKTEIRRVTRIDEFPQDNPWIQKERTWREAHRPAVSGPGAGARGGGGRGVCRIESARVVGTLARFTRDFALAEDVVQEALAEALVPGPATAFPASRPVGWSTAADGAPSTPSGAGRRRTSGTPR